MKPKPSIPNRVTMIVTCVDGTKHKFEFQPRPDLTNQAGRIEQMLEAPNLVLELTDRMMVIPTHSIRSVEFTPKPAKLPERALRNVRIVP